MTLQVGLLVPGKRYLNLRLGGLGCRGVKLWLGGSGTKVGVEADPTFHLGHLESGFSITATSPNLINPQAMRDSEGTIHILEAKVQR